MIIDKIENIAMYEHLLPNINNALKTLEQVKDKTEGKFEFDGGFIIMKSGTTKHYDESKFEVHRKYLDVQVMLEGAESVGWAYLDDLETLDGYKEEGDCELLGGETSHKMKISAGMFYAVFPKDAHKPGIHTHKESNFRKAIIKLEI